MHAHEKIEVRNLTEARRRLNAVRELRPELTIEQRARRVAEYARQVEAYGQIVAYLPPVQPPAPVYRSRFALHGDALRPRG